jgi:hypothetical protein
MWLRSSMLAATVWRSPPTPTTTSTTGRDSAALELPDFTRVMVRIGPAPIAAATSVSMLVRAAPVSNVARTDSDPVVPLTTTSSVYPMMAVSSRSILAARGLQAGTE